MIQLDFHKLVIEKIYIVMIQYVHKLVNENIYVVMIYYVHKLVNEKGYRNGKRNYSKFKGSNNRFYERNS